MQSWFRFLSKIPANLVSCRGEFNSWCACGKVSLSGFFSIGQRFFPEVQTEPGNNSDGFFKKGKLTNFVLPNEARLDKSYLIR